jgi:predicted HicB family RNase H-like nuclease
MMQHIFYRQVLDLTAFDTFRGRSVGEIQQAFQEPIDDHLEFCKKRGKSPTNHFPGD